MGEVSGRGNQVDLRWALSDESDQEVHVIDKGGEVRGGQVDGLVVVSSLLVFEGTYHTVLHARHVVQVLGQGLSLKRILTFLGWSCEDCRTRPDRPS